MSTGLPREDAKIAFDRERRRRVLSRLASRMRFEPDDVSHMLPFEEVVARARARPAARRHRRAGDPARLDRRHRRPPARRLRPLLPPLARAPAGAGSGSPRRASAARRCRRSTSSGSATCYFVQDGHHRVSVARALGDKDINANVVEVRTKLGADRELQMRDLPLKAPRARLPRARPAAASSLRERIQLSDEWRYAQLATLSSPGATARRWSASGCCRGARWRELWFAEEYEPMVDMLREAGLGGGGTETERYLRVAMLRFLLLQRHDWTEDARRAARGRGQAPEHGLRGRTR